MVSIVVPVYNAENYLSPCIESILNQTYKNIEVILVNDGSRDRSGLICEKFAIKDNRVKVIHQKNSGPSTARNVGIKNARGKYIQFVDADDCIEHNMTERLVREMKDNSQLVICGYKIIYKNNNKTIHINKIPDQYGTYGKDDFLKIFGRLYEERLINSPCNKLYVNEIIKNFNLNFPEGIKMGEDLLFNLEYFKLCKKVSVISEPLYYYIKLNNSSLTNSYEENYFSTQKFLYEKVKEFLKDSSSYNAVNKFLVNRVYSYNIIDCFTKIINNNANLSTVEKKGMIKNIISDKSVRENIVYFKQGRRQEKLVGYFIEKKLVNAIYNFFKIKLTLRYKFYPIFKFIKKNFN